jgi:phosphoribosylformylglycinamidine cyclo-ligase
MATYRDAGVDLDAADAVVDRIKPAVTRTWHDGVIGGFGGFAAGITLPAGYTNPVLMMSTDGVGTKAELARQTGRFGGLGWDLVAMCIDDLVAAGARPIAMTDYMAVGRIDVAKVSAVVTSVAAACEEAGVALLGGETAEHPGVMDVDAFDLAGAALGVVEADAVIDGSAIRPGDIVIGLESPNLRSNGFSFVRMLLDKSATFAQEFADPNGEVATTLLEPSVLYTPVVLALIDEVEVHGLAHITGGGLPGNVPRILPDDCAAIIDTSAWTPPPVFASLGEMSEADRDELFRTFNMGIGFVAVVPQSQAGAAINLLAAAGKPATVIGRVERGNGGVTLA